MKKHTKFQTPESKKSIESHKKRRTARRTVAGVMGVIAGLGLYANHKDYRDTYRNAYSESVARAFDVAQFDPATPTDGHELTSWAAEAGFTDHGTEETQSSAQIEYLKEHMPNFRDCGYLLPGYNTITFVPNMQQMQNASENSTSPVSIHKPDHDDSSTYHDEDITVDDLLQRSLDGRPLQLSFSCIDFTTVDGNPLAILTRFDGSRVDVPLDILRRSSFLLGGGTESEETIVLGESMLVELPDYQYLQPVGRSTENIIEILDPSNIVKEISRLSIWIQGGASTPDYEAHPAHGMSTNGVDVYFGLVDGFDSIGSSEIANDGIQEYEGPRTFGLYIGSADGSYYGTTEFDGATGYDAPIYRGV